MACPEYAAGETIDFQFTTRSTSGAPTTLAGTPAVSAYKDNSTTESTAGITLTVDHDSRTGLNHVRITTASDGTFYANGSHFRVVITAGTVGGTSVVGEVVYEFTLKKQAILRPATAGRELAVDANGRVDLGLWIGTAPLALASQLVQVDLVNLRASSQSAIDLKDFADDGYDPATNKVQGVVTVDTVTTVSGNVVGSIGSLAAQAKADVNAEADQALVDINLDHLMKLAAAGSDITDDSALAKIVSKAATASWSTYVNTTDSLEAIRDRGDAAWITATGFSTLTQADIRTAVGLAAANLDTQLAAIKTDTAAILDDTGTSGVVIVSGGISEAKFAADTAKYQAKVGLIDDDTGSADRYVVSFFKNGQPVTSGISGTPTLQIIKVADGTNLLAATNMTQIGATTRWRHTEATSRIVDGTLYLAVVAATIDSVAVTWEQWIGRDT